MLRHARHLVAVLLAVLAPLPAAFGSVLSPEDWWGEILLPAGSGRLRFAATIATDSQPPTVLVDIPQQGMVDAPGTNTSFSAPELVFGLDVGGGERANPVFRVRLLPDGQTAAGEMAQSGVGMPVVMRKGPIGQGALPEPSVATLGSADERWNGAIELPGGQKLDFSLLYSPTSTGPEARLWIPAQMVERVVMREVSREGDVTKFTFEIPNQPEMAWARFEWTSPPGAAEAAGTMTQMGMNFPVKATRAADTAPPSPVRPQNPTGPLPYDVREVTIENPVDGLTLAGTITMPRGEGPFPGVVLVSGSGPQDRDESLMGHKPFLVLADHLTRAGIAVLRYDDRGVGASTGSFDKATSRDFSTDAQAALEFLRAQPGIDPARVGLCGHSEGAIVAPMVAARSPDVAFLVLLAGPAVTGREILERQMVDMLRAGGLPEDKLAEASRYQAKALRQLLDNAPESEIQETLVHLVRAQSPVPLADDIALQQARLAGAQLASPWFREFVAYDPRPDLEKVHVPVLAMWGSKDLQVPPDQNEPEMKKALAANPHVTFVVLPGLNHLFQSCGTGSAAEYGVIEETFAPVALDQVSSWVLNLEQ